MGRLGWLGATWVVLQVALAGCAGVWGGADPSEDHQDWIHVSEGEALHLSLDTLGDDDWLTIEFRYGPQPLITSRLDAFFEFDSPVVNPARAYACPLLTAGTQVWGDQGTFMPPFIVPERLQPGAWSWSQPEAHVQQAGVEADVTARPTGSSISLGGLLLMAKDPGNVTYLTFGLAEHEAWQQAGARFNIEVGLEESFEYREVHRGDMMCRVQFEDYDSGEYLRTTHLTRATDLQAAQRVDDGLVAYVQYAGDTVRQVEVHDPDGTEAYRNGTTQQTGVTVGLDAEQLVLCSDHPGTWSFGFPRLEGSDHRTVWADTLILDVPARLHDGFDCTLSW